MEQEVVDLLVGAGLGDIVMPRKEFMAEHKHLISLLRKYKHPELQKEADSQETEMKSYTGGFGKASGFIRRLMAENTITHKGQYGNPTKLPKGSTMNRPAEFDYKKIANASQKGTNTSSYGASPFIQKHFGTTEFIPFNRKRGTPPPLEPYPNKKRSKKTTELNDTITPTGRKEEPNIHAEDTPTITIEELPPPPPPKEDKKLSRAEKARAKRDAEKAEAEAERKRQKEARRVSISPELEDKLTEYAKLPQNHGLPPRMVAERYYWFKLNEEDIRNEGLEPGNRTGANYLQSGWSKVEQKIRMWLQQKFDDDPEFIPSVAKGSVPVVSEKEGRYNFNQHQIDDMKYQAGFLDQREGGSDIPPLLNNISWTLNEVEPKSVPRVSDKAIIYWLQNTAKVR
jgi:hypothetical protein